MSKPATYTGDRGVNNHATFLDEESYRGRMPGRQLVYPRPHFVQPDNGAHIEVGGSLGIHYGLAGRPMKYGNIEKDLDGGYY